MKSPLYLIGAAATLFMSIGCGTSPEPTEVATVSTVAIDGSKYLLADEPDGAVGVIEALETLADGSPLVVVGRIGGSDNPWIEGRAAFMLLDASKSMVAEGEEDEDGEMCTGDCCAAERAGCTTLVKVVDADGKLVAADARKLLGLSDSDTVVVSGKVNKDEAGNFVVLAEGVYIRR